MESVAAVCSASIRRFWQATVSKCFITHDQLEEQESEAIVLLKGEVTDAQKAIDELKAALEERDSALELSKQEVIAAEERLAASQQENKRLQQFMYEKLKELEDLKESYSKAEKQVEEVITNPCSCFFFKHIESYLYETYMLDEEQFRAMEEPPVPRTISDTNGFLPEAEFKIQLSDYEYSDDSEDSDASTESSSSTDTSDDDDRYIHSDQSSSDSSESSSESSESSEEEPPSPRRIPVRPLVTAAKKVATDDDDDEDLWWRPQ